MKYGKYPDVGLGDRAKARAGWVIETGPKHMYGERINEEGYKWDI